MNKQSFIKVMITMLISIAGFTVSAQNTLGYTLIAEKDWSGVATDDLPYYLFPRPANGSISGSADGIQITVTEASETPYLPSVTILETFSLKENSDYKIVINAKFPCDGILKVILGGWGEVEYDFPVKATGDFQDIECDFPWYVRDKENTCILFLCGNFVGTTVVKKVSVWGKESDGTSPNVTSFSKDGFTYKIIESTSVEISSVDLNVTSADIPSRVTNDGKSFSVTSIGDKAFKDCKNLTTVIIPSSIKSIGKGAFEGCKALASISIPSSILSIRAETFMSCSGLTSVTIPNSVTSIDPSSFYGCSSLTSITIPNSVGRIDSCAFYGCSSLSSIIFPNSVRLIGNYAFYGCSNLKKVVSEIKVPFNISNETFGEDTYKTAELIIPNGRKTEYQSKTGWSLFSNIKENTSEQIFKRTIHVENPGTLSNFISEDEKYQIVELKLTGEINGDDFKLLREMAGKSTYGDSWFSYGNTEGMLKTLDLSGVKIIAGGSYYMGWEDVDTYEYYKLNNDNEIPTYVFLGCSNLSSITIPSSVRSIGDCAFLKCSGLKSIVSEIVNPFEILESVFYSTDNTIFSTAKLIVPAGTKEKYQSTNGWKNFQNIVEASGGSSEDVRKFASEGITYIINDNGTSVTVTAGNSKYKGSISIPSSVSNNGKNYDVTSIGYCAFGDCTGLTSISIPNSVMFIQYGAFQNCSSLTSITLPNSIQSIAQFAFMGCIGLRTVESEIQNPFVIEANTFGEDTYKKAELIVPQGTESAYQSTAGWSLFANITSPSSPEMVVEDNVVYEIEGGTVAVVHADDVSGDVTIEASVVINGETYDVTIIAEEAFKDCAEMTSVEIPNSITIIGEKAFNGCSGLRVIKIGKGVLEIAKKAFANIFKSAGTRGEDDGLHFFCDTELVPATSADAFDGTDIAHATLHVPDNLVETYKVVAPWNGFGTIVGLTETGIIDISVDLSDVKIFDMQGNRIDKPRKGLNIIRTKDGKAKKVVMR